MTHAACLHTFYPYLKLDVLLLTPINSVLSGTLGMFLRSNIYICRKCSHKPKYFQFERLC